MLQIGCFVLVVVVGSTATRSVQAQYPFGGPSFSASHGYNNQSFYRQPVHGQCSYGQLGYGQLGYGQGGYGQGGYGQGVMFQKPAQSFGPNYFAQQPGYAPQPSLGYGGGYPPAVSLNPSFYPSANGYNAFAPIQNHPSHKSHHSHHSDHAWHPGHYLLGH